MVIFVKIDLHWKHLQLNVKIAPTFYLCSKKTHQNADTADMLTLCLIYMQANTNIANWFYWILYYDLFCQHLLEP